MTVPPNTSDIRRRPGGTALLINPPVYDTQYWAEWSQPYGLLRVASWLRQRRYKRVEMFDFMETDEKRQVHRHRISPEEEYHERERPSSRVSPIRIEKGGEALELYKQHFGRTWAEFDEWLEAKGFDAKHPPTEIWVSAIMTYWWESVRDLTLRLKRRWGKRTKIILGGIYPTLCPDHARAMTQADIVWAGEIEEANDLWTDLSVYDNVPQYAVITPSRGCRFNCAYCAQRTLNGQRRKVHHRSPEDIVEEMRHKHDTWGIRDFAFYADALLDGCTSHFQRVLELVAADERPLRLYAPEGMDVSTIARSDRLAELLKAANFQKVYLPVERLDEGYLQSLNRKHARLDDVAVAVNKLVAAGFKPRYMDVNAFVLYGLPHEKIEDVVRTILYISETVGSIIPMLFTPVPTTTVYRDWLPWFRERGWDRDLHMLNGKLLPFIGVNAGSISDYVDLQRLMYTLNTHYRDHSFRVFGDTQVAQAFRNAVADESWLPPRP